MIKLCIANRKGGVSKTTTAVSLSSILAELEHKVLLMDLDPQGDATDNMGFDIDSLQYTMYDVMTNKVQLSEAIQTSPFGVDVAPANSRLADAELELANRINRESVLSDIINESELDYDFIIFDSPPNLGLLSINGLVASDSVIVSVDMGRFSFSGIVDLLEVVSLIRKSKLNPSLDVLGVLTTKVDYRTRAARIAQQVLKDNFDSKVFETRIKQNTAIVDSQRNQTPINFFNKDSSGYLEYFNFTEEVLERCQKKEVIK